MSLWGKTEEFEIVCVSKEMVKEGNDERASQDQQLDKDVQKRWWPAFPDSPDTEKARHSVLKLLDFNFTHTQKRFLL